MSEHHELTISGVVT